jgi:hypothetical protein
VRAAVITALTGPESVEIRDVAEPAPRPGQVLIDVEYAGIVFPDVLQTRGEYQVRPELVLGPSLPELPVDAARDGLAAGKNVVLGATTHEMSSSAVVREPPVRTDSRTGSARHRAPPGAALPRPVPALRPPCVCITGPVIGRREDCAPRDGLGNIPTPSEIAMREQGMCSP